MAIAEPGSGKTLGYLLPTVAHLQRLNHDANSQPEGPVALVLVPTRELALQVTAVCKTFHKELGLRAQAIIGGIDKAQQVIFFAREMIKAVTAWQRKSAHCLPFCFPYSRLHGC